MPTASPHRPRAASQRRTAALSASALLIGLGFVEVGNAEPYSRRMMLHGAVETTPVSGRAGGAYTLADDKGDHAMYGLFSVERRDNPCYLALRTESINDPAENGGAIRDVCGDRATSGELGVAYENTSFFGTRVFVSGIRVCMNNDRSRVKGFQIRGRRVTADGGVLDLEAGEPVHGQAGGSDVSLHLNTMPAKDRAHCDGWMRWADCPNATEVATGLVAHFDTSDEPRSLTGLALQCRNLGREYTPR